MSEVFTVPAAEFDCATMLARFRWPDGFQCACGGRRFGRIQSRPRVWRCADCRRQRSVTADTALHRSHLAIRDWLLAMVSMCDPGGISAAALADLQQRRYETIWRLAHKLRAGFPPATEPPAPPYCSWPMPMIMRDDPRKRVLTVFLGASGSPVMLPADSPRNLAWRRNGGPGRSETWPAGMALRRRLSEVHHGVSNRWLPRYVGEFCGVWSAADAAARMAAAATRREWIPWRSLSPPPYQSSRAPFAIQLRTSSTLSSSNPWDPSGIGDPLMSGAPSSFLIR
jgi:hypothetical protein